MKRLDLVVEPLDLLGHRLDSPGEAREFVLDTLDRFPEVGQVRLEAVDAGLQGPQVALDTADITLDRLDVLGLVVDPLFETGEFILDGSDGVVVVVGPAFEAPQVGFGGVERLVDAVEPLPEVGDRFLARSEERRVGKECRL